MQGVVPKLLETPGRVRNANEPLGAHNEEIYKGLLKLDELVANRIPLERINEGYARMANLSDDILRIICSNRAWTKNYGTVVGLTKNPKTPLAMSLNFMPRLNDRDLQMLSIDRNVPEPLRVAARKRILAGISKK